MKLSAELRWFWNGSLPNTVEQWFRGTKNHSYPAGGGGVRVDQYVVDPLQIELGIKRRGGGEGVEVKGLVRSAAEETSFGALRGHFEIWGKWTSYAIDLDTSATVKTQKRRWLRKFEPLGGSMSEIPLKSDETTLDGRVVPARGCNVELTAIEILGDPVSEPLWWTLGFEAFGELGEVETILAATLAEVEKNGMPELGAGIAASYPVWLSRITSGGSIRT